VVFDGVGRAGVQTFNDGAVLPILRVADGEKIAVKD
jgi:hypothetical protein